jgi:hypothetical protein
MGVLASVGALVTTPAAATTLTSGCSTTDTAFCISYAQEANNLGASTPNREAATPFDLTVALNNTTVNRRANQPQWLSAIDVDILGTANGGLSVTPSKNLPDGLLVAGTAGGCGGSGDFSSCTAGAGTALIKVTGSGGADGVYDATFGVQRIRNVNPPTVPGAVSQFNVDLTICVATPLGACSVAQNTTAVVAISAAGAGSGRLTLPATTSFAFSVGGSNGTADASLDTIRVSLPGVVNIKATNGDVTQYVVLYLPSTCGTASGTGRATARNGAQAVVPVGFTLVSCPTVTALTATGTAPFVAKLSAAGAAAAGRTIGYWIWTFGDGKSATTTTPTVSHTYTSAAPRTVSVKARDYNGAFSPLRTVALKGTGLAVKATPSTLNYGQTSRLTGKLIDAASKVGLGGRKVTVLRCRRDHTTCSSVATLTTSTGSSTLGTWALTVKPTANTAYSLSYVGAASVLGTRSWLAVLVKPLISATQSASTVRLGQAVTLSGKVVPNRSGKTVAIQRYGSGTWTTIGTRVLSSSSTYSIVVKPAVRGKTLYRVVLVGDATFATAVSRTVTVSAT